MNVPIVKGILQRPTELLKNITMELFEMFEKVFLPDEYGGFIYD